MTEIDNEKVAVRSSPPATWFAGILIVFVLAVIGYLMVSINTANDENAAELRKMQEAQPKTDLQGANGEKQPGGNAADRQDANAGEEHGQTESPGPKN